MQAQRRREVVDYTEFNGSMIAVHFMLKDQLNNGAQKMYYNENFNNSGIMNIQYDFKDSVEKIGEGISVSKNPLDVTKNLRIKNTNFYHSIDILQKRHYEEHMCSDT